MCSCSECPNYAYVSSLDISNIVSKVSNFPTSFLVINPWKLKCIWECVGWENRAGVICITGSCHVYQSHSSINPISPFSHIPGREVWWSKPTPREDVLRNCRRMMIPMLGRDSLWWKQKASRRKIWRGEAKVWGTSHIMRCSICGLLYSLVFYISVTNIRCNVTIISINNILSSHPDHQLRSAVMRLNVMLLFRVRDQTVPDWHHSTLSNCIHYVIL